MVTKCGMSLSVWVLLQYKDRLSGGKNTLFPSMEIPIIDIRRSHDCLFFIMRIAILVKQYLCSGSAGASVVAHSVALPLIEIAFSTLDCSIVPTCGAWCSATAAKRGPLKQSWAEIQHSRDDEPLGVLMQMQNVRVNGFFFFSSLGVLPGVLVDTLSLCSGNFCVECVLIVLHKFYIEL